jgi:hypothetical protein
MKDYKVGDSVWIPRYGREQKTITCPICFGKKEVTLILGNGEYVVLPCSYCAQGYEPPGGTVAEYILEPRAELVVITGKETKEGRDGVTVEYKSTGGYIHAEDRVFGTEAEAMAVAREMASEDQKQQDERTEYIKADKRKSFAWNAGYHLREAKRDRESAEYHEKMARVCKEREPSK